MILISMIPDKVYEIGNMLGLNKEDIEGVERKKSNEKVSIMPPADAYNNAIGRYGTVSIKDF